MSADGQEAGPDDGARILVLPGDRPEPSAAGRFRAAAWQRDGLDLRLLASPEEIEGHLPAQLLIVASERRDGRRAGGLFRRKCRHGQLLFLVPAGELERFRAGLPFSPELATAAVLAAEAPEAELRAAIAGLLQAARQEQALGRLYGRVNELVSGAGGARPADQERQRRLEIAERYLSTILSHVQEALVATDKDGVVVQLNQVAERLFGGQEVVGRSVAELFGEASRAPVAEWIRRSAAGEVLHAKEAVVEAVTGSRILELGIAPVVGPSGAVEGISLSAHDVTRRRQDEEALREAAARLEERVEERTRELAETNRSLRAEIDRREAVETQIRQMQKMEAVGQLTGGIAHDFNNMLAVIMSGLNLIQRRLRRGDTAVDELIAGALEGAERAATLTRRLLAFARQQPLSPRVLNANQMVSDMSELLHRTLGEAVELETVLAAGLWQVRADANQLENAVVNLAVNARDAMPEGGRLTIETANCHVDEAYAAQHAIEPGQYVMVAVTDTGTGMTPDTLAKAFDPFFTTKEPGRGTGLGLSQVFGFVRQSSGHVKIYSEPDQGTTVKIYLPRHHGAVQATPEATPEALPTGGPDEVVLLVEDEARVREVTVQMLRELGYRVLEAEGGAEALRLLGANPEIRLLFTDIVMPGMNGRQLADEALKRRPDLKVLFTTGYTRNAVVHNGLLDPGVHLLQKPATLEQLARKVRAALDG